MKLQKKESLWGFLFTAPFLGGFCLFFLIPFGISLWYTVTSGVGAVRFVGLENYLSMLGSKAFRLAAGNTFRFIGVGVPLIMALSFLLSLGLYQKFRGARFFRSALLYPMVVPIASTVMFFQVMFADQGVVNHLCSALHLPVWRAGCPPAGPFGCWWGCMCGKTAGTIWCCSSQGSAQSPGNFGRWPSWREQGSGSI